ncbi:hypothetical protein BC830DRAFT_1233725 [Chytriomyces sp. MP71]|nr:hypothetical protein BC830DRAFT_1233725 [Chytriomyces sp. MP71]
MAFHRSVNLMKGNPKISTSKHMTPSQTTATTAYFICIILTLLFGSVMIFGEIKEPTPHKGRNRIFRLLTAAFLFIHSGAGIEILISARGDALSAANVGSLIASVVSSCFADAALIFTLAANLDVMMIPYYFAISIVFAFSTVGAKSACLGVLGYSASNNFNTDINLFDPFLGGALASNVFKIYVIVSYIVFMYYNIIAEVKVFVVLHEQRRESIIEWLTGAITACAIASLTSFVLCFAAFWNVDPWVAISMDALASVFLLALGMMLDEYFNIDSVSRTSKNSSSNSKGSSAKSQLYRTDPSLAGENHRLMGHDIPSPTTKQDVLKTFSRTNLPSSESTPSTGSMFKPGSARYALIMQSALLYSSVLQSADPKPIDNVARLSSVRSAKTKPPVQQNGSIPSIIATSNQEHQGLRKQPQESIMNASEKSTKSGIVYPASDSSKRQSPNPPASRNVSLFETNNNSEDALCLGKESRRTSVVSLTQYDRVRGANNLGLDIRPKRHSTATPTRTPERHSVSSDYRPFASRSSVVSINQSLLMPAGSKSTVRSQSHVNMRDYSKKPREDPFLTGLKKTSRIAHSTDFEDPSFAPTSILVQSPSESNPILSSKSRRHTKPLVIPPILSIREDRMMSPLPSVENNFREKKDHAASTTWPMATLSQASGDSDDEHAAFRRRSRSTGSKDSLEVPGFRTRRSTGSKDSLDASGFRPKRGTSSKDSLEVPNVRPRKGTGSKDSLDGHVNHVLRVPNSKLSAFKSAPTISDDSLEISTDGIRKGSGSKDSLEVPSMRGTKQQAFSSTPAMSKDSLNSPDSSRNLSTSTGSSHRIYTKKSTTTGKTRLRNAEEVRDYGRRSSDSSGDDFA